jgi:hypothetical protein
MALVVAIDIFVAYEIGVKLVDGIVCKVHFVHPDVGIVRLRVL